MLAHVYKSLKRADTYVYLARRDDFACVPAPLLTSLGRLQHVLDVELAAERKLAREDAATVRTHLAERGFHLQFPPSAAGDPLTDDWGTDA
jgi:uncharacterized protein YcgL (UPF0745 family)